MSNTTAVFGRAWELAVNTDTDQLLVSSDAWDPEALRITFEIFQPGYTAYWFADIAIYNLSAGDAQKVFKQGDTVILRAGYRGSQNYGVVWEGKLFQPLWERVNVTDYKLTLHCIIGLEEYTENLVNFVHSAYASQADLVTRMMSSAQTPIRADSIDMETLSQKKLPRGKVIFGSPGKYFAQIAADNKMDTWVGPNGMNMGLPEPNSWSTPDLVYGPQYPPGATQQQTDAEVTRTLVGTPQQTSEGVMFRVLLDARLKVQRPPLMVKLDQTVIRQMPLAVGQQYVNPLDQDGYYIVSSVRHIGDNRGTPWYTEVCGYTQKWAQGLLSGLYR